jgi:hypothetical protein
LGAFVPERAKKATPTAEAIMNQALTPGGERPLLDAKGDQTEIAPTGLKGLVTVIRCTKDLNARTKESFRCSIICYFTASFRNRTEETRRYLREAATTGSGATPDQTDHYSSGNEHRYISRAFR